MKRYIEKVMIPFAILGIVIVIFGLIPYGIGCIVSGKSFPWMNVESQWIGFWGSYIGALIGGLTPFLILFFTIRHEKQKQIREEKIKCCEKIMHFVLELDNLSSIVTNEILAIKKQKRRDKERFYLMTKDLRIKHQEIDMYLDCIADKYNFENMDILKSKIDSFKKNFIDIIEAALHDEQEMNIINMLPIEAASFTRENMINETKCFISQNII